MAEKSEKGGKTSELAKEHVLSLSTISTILQNKDKIKATTMSDASTRMIKGRKKIVKMERLLHWNHDRQM
jgi:hypothetical protein